MNIKEPVTGSLTIEKSRFIAYLFPCDTEESYKEHLKDIRKKHYDASHVCSAFVSKDARRSSDDGEPAGTAGVPILNVLLKNDLCNVCALVVRYFGGIKLGAGGLIRAYGSTVSEALKDAVFSKEITMQHYILPLSYELGNKVERFLENNTTLLAVEYEEKMIFRFASDDPAVLDKIQELTHGIKPNLLGEIITEKML